MKSTLQKFLMPATLLAFLAISSLPSLRADDSSKPAVGAASDGGSAALDPGAKDSGSDTAQPAETKIAKKKRKHKHKKASNAQPTGDQANGAAAAAAPPRANSDK